MAKWGDGFRWGGGTLWGGEGVVSGAFTGEVVWIVNIDWMGTGFINESEHTRNVDTKRGKEHYINPDGSGFEKVRPGRATITMDNSNGRFDPNNTTSPLYGYILPGRKIQLSVYIVATNVTEVRFTGHITDIQPSSGSSEVIISAEDGIRWLTDAEYASGVAYSKTISEAIDLVLSFVNWPYQRNVKPSLQPLQVFEPGEGSAINVIQELAEANLGVFFIDRHGKATFYPVSYNITTSHSLDQAILLKDIGTPQPWETVRNKIRIVANRKGKRPASAIWSMGGIEAFAGGQTQTFTANFKSADGITVESLVANSQIDGNGADVSGNFTIGKSEVTNKTCLLTVKNNGGGTAYLTVLQLAGSAIVEAPENMDSADATSISAYGPRAFNLDNPFMQDRAFAAAYAVMVKDHLKTPHKDVIIQIQQRPSTQYAIDLYHKVALTSEKLGINGTYTVVGMEEKWLNDTGQDVVTTLYLQAVLYDATVITPDPFIPGALPVIKDPSYPKGDWDYPTYDEFPMSYDQAGFSFVIGNGTTISTGIVGMIQVPFDLILTAADMVAKPGTTGSCVIDIWKCNYTEIETGVHPVVGDSICGGNTMAITTSYKSQSTLVGWNLYLYTGDWLFFNVVSADLGLVTLSMMGTGQ